MNHSFSRQRRTLFFLIVCSALGTSCTSGDGAVESDKIFGPLISESISRQATLEHTDTSHVARSQRAVIFDQDPNVCVLLVRGSIALSQRCYVRRGVKWTLVSEAVKLSGG
jgi:hypothetical protein